MKKILNIKHWYILKGLIEIFFDLWKFFFWIVIVLWSVWTMLQLFFKGGWLPFALSIILIVCLVALTEDSNNKFFKKMLFGGNAWGLGILFLLSSTFLSTYKFVGSEEIAVVSDVWKTNESIVRVNLFKINDIDYYDLEFEINIDNDFYSDRVKGFYNLNTKKGRQQILNLDTTYLKIIEETLYDVNLGVGASKKEQDEIKTELLSALKSEEIEKIYYWQRYFYNVPQQH